MERRNHASRPSFRFGSPALGYDGAMTETPAGHTQDGGGEPSARLASIRVYPDGPLLVRGSFSITDEQGREIEVVRKTVSLCRCGRSGLAPLCDGSHAKGPGAAVRPASRSDT